MADSKRYGTVRNNENLVLNNNPPGVTKDYVKDNEDKIADEIMPDAENEKATIENNK